MAGTQRAVFVKEIGKPVESGSREIPSPKEDEVLVKITATMRESNHYVLISIQTNVESNNHSPSP
jgi:Zn-dependent alcohol dehydrogenase